MFTDKEIQAINKTISKKEFESVVYLHSYSDSDVNIVTYSFEIVGIKPMISVGEWYDYAVYDITILDASENLKKFLSIVINFFIKTSGNEDIKQKLESFLKKDSNILQQVKYEINYTLSYFGQGEYPHSTMRDVYVSDKLVEEIKNVDID